MTAIHLTLANLQSSCILRSFLKMLFIYYKHRTQATQ